MRDPATCDSRFRVRQWHDCPRKALPYRAVGSSPEVAEIDTPEPGPGEVRLKVTAAGFCHSDSFIMGLPAEQSIDGLPLTRGHEGAGIVDKLGAGTTGVSVGDSIAAHGRWGCGRCHACAEGPPTTARMPD